MLGEIGRHAVRLLHVRIDLRVVLLRLLELLLHFANRGKILVEFAAIRGTQAGLQLLRIVGDEIQNAAAVLRFPHARFGTEDHAVAEQPFKQRSRIQNRRQRLGLAAPRQVVGVRAGIAGIAIARLARILQADFHRREARRPAHVVGHNLIHRYAGLDIHQALLHLYAGQVAAAAAPVIARAIQQRAPGIVRQVAEHEDVVLERLQRLEDARQFGKLALVVRVPVAHDDAVGHVDERHADGRFAGARRRKGGHHGIQKRKGDGGSHAAQKGAPGNRFASHHGCCSPLRD